MLNKNDFTKVFYAQCGNFRIFLPPAIQFLLREIIFRIFLSFIENPEVVKMPFFDFGKFHLSERAKIHKKYQNS